MSATLPPLRLKLVKASCPGVSTIRRPGISMPVLKLAIYGPISCLSVSTGKKLAPICCVIPPASRACTLVFLSSSRSEVFPASTCPNTQTIGWRVGINEFTFHDKLSTCHNVFLVYNPNYTFSVVCEKALFLLLAEENQKFCRVCR